MKRRRLVNGLALAVALAGVPSSAIAHSPIDGSRQYPTSDPVLEWKFYNPGYSAWLADPIRDALDESDGDAHWDHHDLNNSNVQNFVLDSGGSGTIRYTADSTSPCSGNAEWLMCADQDNNDNGSKSDWVIWIRSLDGAPLNGWKWADQGYSTSSYVTFDIERNVLHEAIHITLLPLSHDSQSAIHTLMTVNSPDDNDADWNVEHTQECDQARMQMVFGMLDSADGVAQCFDDTSLAMTTSGLATVASLTSPVSGCVGEYLPFSGRIRTGTHSAYGQMSDVGLGSRTMTVKRNGTTVLTATTNSSGYFSGQVFANAAGTFSFTSSFAGVGPNALAADTSAADSVTILPPC
jgi:hypothetical protein